MLLVGLHVPNCELFDGRSKYRVRLGRPSSTVLQTFERVVAL